MDNPQLENDAAPLYLEDFSVGMRFVSASHTLDPNEIKAFGAQFDPQPFHLDDAAAKESFFGGLVASGWHTAGITMKLLVGSAPIAGGLIGAGGELAWPRPTRPGDVLHVETEIVEITPFRSRPAGMVIVRCETKNQNGDPVQIMTAKLIVPRRT